MKSLLKNIFVANWQRKLIALIIAAIIWSLVNHSITVTRTLANVPVRVLNIPVEKTVDGMESVTLTLTGSRRILQRLSAGDLEVIADAAGKGEQWTIEVSKRNLGTIHGDIDLVHGVSDISPLELTFHLSSLVTAKIPVVVTAPTGEPPQGYRYLDIWPQRLVQKVSGPEKQIEELKQKGIKLTFDLDRVSREELDALYTSAKQAGRDEIRYFVPDSWREVILSHMRGKVEPLNDPEASFLHIGFLKQELLPIGADLPVDVFYPLKTAGQFNPQSHKLAIRSPIDQRDGIDYLAKPLFMGNVSRAFLDTVRDNLRVVVMAADQPQLDWSIQIVGSRELEDVYVQKLMAMAEGSQSEDYLRNRFRQYVRSFELFTSGKQPLHLQAHMTGDAVVVRQ